MHTLTHSFTHTHTHTHTGHYTGECINCVEGNNGSYIIEGKWKGETWFLNSDHLDNSALRYANDACSGYTADEYHQHPDLTATGYTKGGLDPSPDPNTIPNPNPNPNTPTSHR